MNFINAGEEMARQGRENQGRLAREARWKAEDDRVIVKYSAYALEEIITWWGDGGKAHEADYDDVYRYLKLMGAGEHCMI